MRQVLVSGLAVSLVAGAIAVSGAAGRAMASRFCAPIVPPKVPLPTNLGMPSVVKNYSFPLVAHARAHGALCHISLSTPTDGYLFNVGWVAFPSHALALADWKTYAFRTEFVKVTSVTPAVGLPTPNRIIKGSSTRVGVPAGVPTIYAQFVYGPCLVTAIVNYGLSQFQAMSLAQWAVKDLRALGAT
jgi:hypothetical protein